MMRSIALAVLVGRLALAGAAHRGPTTAPPSLEGTSWILAEVGGVPAAPPTPESISPRMQLQRHGGKKQLTGATGCAALRGGYDLFAGRLRIAADVPKKTACPENIRLQEQAFLAALRQTADYRIANGALTLLSAEGGALARFVVAR